MCCADVVDRLRGALGDDAPPDEQIRAEDEIVDFHIRNGDSCIVFNPTAFSKRLLFLVGVFFNLRGLMVRLLNNICEIFYLFI